MAPLSPRRSSRARPTHPQSHQSSGSSSNTGRSERNTRSVFNNKPGSGKSTPSASLSSEPLEDFDDTMMSRRRTRGANDESLDRALRTATTDDYAMVSNNDDIQDEEDEAVRCICGSEDYPGLPPADNPDTDFFASIELTEDLIGFFVQCDICKVWQHGACVGIFSAEASPDEYFCEQCRKDLHKVHTASNGQKYSKFLPLHRTSRNTSRATSLAKEGTRSPRSRSKGRPNSASQLGKRRSTMNSRDAAYDDEQLRRAIEASKEGGAEPSIEGGSVRRPKRGRSDSEENDPHVKRQRTSSRSMSPAVQAEKEEKEDSDDESTGREKKQQRNGRAQREKTEKEERERQRQEAANKRKGRAERRRADDSPPSEEAPPVVAKSVKKSVEPIQPVAEPREVQAPAVPDTPPPAPVQVPASSHKRGGARSNHKGKGKGKNQYTKDREFDNDDSPARSMSRDIQKVMQEDAAPTATTQQAKTPHAEAKQKAKAAAVHSKVSMHEMRRRVGGIMDFISRVQVDLAEEVLPSSSSSSSSSSADTPKKDGDGVGGGADAVKPFKDLSCMEMMDVLTRDMVKWQNSYV